MVKNQFALLPHSRTDTQQPLGNQQRCTFNLSIKMQFSDYELFPNKIIAVEKINKTKNFYFRKFWKRESHVQKTETREIKFTYFVFQVQAMIKYYSRNV